MYSYGASARAGVGKRGHGGRPYRPPRKRRDPNSTPPPLKECSCLVEIHLPEYARAEPLGRQHLCFGGRQAMEACQRSTRSEYQVHLMIPGKKQAGPVSMVAKTYREALPALAWLLDHLTEEDNQIRGRIHRNVKDERDQILDGFFLLRDQSISPLVPCWLFQSETWSVLACRLIDQKNTNLNGENQQATSTEQSMSDTEKSTAEGHDHAATLQTCLDNIIFRLGKDAIGQLNIFLDPHLEFSFAVGNPSQGGILKAEITTTLQY